MSSSISSICSGAVAAVCVEPMKLEALDRDGMAVIVIVAVETSVSVVVTVIGAGGAGQPVFGWGLVPPPPYPPPPYPPPPYPPLAGPSISPVSSPSPLSPLPLPPPEVPVSIGASPLPAVGSLLGKAYLEEEEGEQPYAEPRGHVPDGLVPNGLVPEGLVPDGLVPDGLVLYFQLGLDVSMTRQAASRQKLRIPITFVSPLVDPVHPFIASWSCIISSSSRRLAT